MFLSRESGMVPVLLAERLPHDMTGLRAFAPGVVFTCAALTVLAVLDVMLPVALITTDSGWVDISSIAALLVLNLTVVAGWEVAMRDVRIAWWFSHNRYCQWSFYARYRIPAPHRGWWWMSRRYARAYAHASVTAQA